VYLYRVHRSWVGGRRRIRKHYLGVEGTEAEVREAPGEGRKDVEEMVRELEAQGLSKEGIAYQLMQEHYNMRDILRATHVSLRTLKGVKGGGEAAEAKRNADEAVITAAEAKALKEWTGKETLEELMALGRLVHGMGVRQRAARCGIPLLDYVELALNFYDSWYGPVVELINLGVLTMDGFINGDAVCYELKPAAEAEGAMGRPGPLQVLRRGAATTHGTFMQGKYQTPRDIIRAAGAAAGHPIRSRAAQGRCPLTIELLSKSVINTAG